MAERDLVAEVLVELSMRNFLVWRNNTGQFWACRRKGVELIPVRPVNCGVKGSPDVIGFCRSCSKFIGIECKFERNTPSEEQKRFARFIIEAGGIHAFAWTLEAAIAVAAAHQGVCRG